MSSLYTCRISNKQFKSKEELFEHYMNHYVTHENDESVVHAIHRYIQYAFPKSRVNVKECGDHQIYYDVKMKGLPYGLQFEGIILSVSYVEEPSFSGNTFRSAEEMVKSFQKRVHNMEHLIEQAHRRAKTKEEKARYSLENQALVWSMWQTYFQ